MILTTTRGKHLLDILDGIVASFRDTNTITDIVDNLDNTYTVTTPNAKDLATNDFITVINTIGFNNEDLKIQLIDTTSFLITNLDSGIVIPAIFGTWTANNPFFDYETYSKESEFLTLLNEDVFKRYQKFPLILCLLNIPELREQEVFEKNEAELIIYFISETKTEIFAPERLTTNFKPILIPIYEKFLNAIRNSNYSLFVTTGKLIPHTYKEFYHSPNSFNDFVDAIEIKFTYPYTTLSGDCVNY